MFGGSGGPQPENFVFYSPNAAFWGIPSSKTLGQSWLGHFVSNLAPSPATGKAPWPAPQYVPIEPTLIFVLTKAFANKNAPLIQCSQPSIILNSFIRKPCYPDRIFRNRTLTMGNTLVFPEICFPDPELNFLDQTYDLLYKFPHLSWNPETRLSNFLDFLFQAIVWTLRMTVQSLLKNRIGHFALIGT